MIWAIFDLDGTLCEVEHRVLLAVEKKWDEFYAGILSDPPRRAECTLVQAFAQSSALHRVALVTARPERYRVETRAWLRAQGIFYDELHMRGNKDRRPGPIVKRDIYEEHFQERDVLFVVEDDDKIVEMWRGLGITCFHCQPGEPYGNE